MEKKIIPENTSIVSKQNLEKKIIPKNTSIESKQNLEKKKKIIPFKSDINKNFDILNLNIEINQIENNSSHINDNIIEKNETIIYNNEVKLFFASICSHKLKDTVLQNLKNLINSNLKLYEQNPVKLSILKYRLCNNICNNEKIGNFFFDIGFNDTVLETELNNFKLDHIIDNNNFSQKREVIIINEDSDVNLRDMIAKIKIFEKDDNLYINIIRLIIAYMGEDCDDFIFNKFMQTHSFKYKTNFVKIGDIDCGLDRHKSLLFKYLCDILNLQCSLFRNVKTDCNNFIYDDHIWNLISIKDKIYVVDFRYFPNKIVRPTNTETSKYYKIIRFVI